MKKISFLFVLPVLLGFCFPFFASAEVLVPSGWDYNFTKRCLKSTNFNAPNYFSDTTQCGSGPKNWTIAVQSEKTLGASCPGPNNQSFPINTKGSPVTINWLPHSDEFGKSNWSVNIKTDLYNNTHPCGAGYFTWVMFMDHVNQNGGPLPRPDRLKLSATVNFNDYVVSGATRAIAMWQGYWDGKFHSIELTFQGKNWGDNYPADAALFDVKSLDYLDFIAVDGKAFGIEVPRLKDTVIQIPWNTIIQNLVDKGTLKAPSIGWANATTEAVGLGYEVNNTALVNSAVADLWLTNFRTEAVDEKPIGYVDSFPVSDSVIGWTLDTDSPANSLLIHSYFDGPSGQSPYPPYVWTADKSRPDVNNVTGYPGNHGFQFKVPAQFRDGKMHSVYVYGIDAQANPDSNFQLIGSPKSFTISPSFLFAQWLSAIMTSQLAQLLNWSK